jgi:LysM repeat protein
MKQNEKILVYVVTGFLFVILAVAVIFGRDSTGKAAEKQTGAAQANAASSLEDVLNNAKLLNTQLVPEANLATNVQFGPPSPAEEMVTLLGPSRHERDCRVVTARVGDSLGGLVQRWCGSTDALPQAERMNEDVHTLRPGQDVFLPWVEDVVVLEAFRNRPAKTETAAASGNGKEHESGKGASKGTKDKDAASAVGHTNGKAAEPAAAGVRTYVVKAGDKMWSIAEKEVGKAKAHAFLQRVKELNPELDLDHLKVAQSIKLPSHT